MLVSKEIIGGSLESKKGQNNSNYSLEAEILANLSLVLDLKQ